MKRPLALLTASAVAGVIVTASPLAARAATATAVISSVSASWRAADLTIRYDWDTLGGDGGDTSSKSGKFETLVDGVVVNTVNAGRFDFGDGHTVKVKRATKAGPAHVSIRVTSCNYDDDSDTTYACSTATDYSKTVFDAPPEGRSSAVVLLSKLHVTKESHASSYKRSKFKLWIDANGDHENTRVEVLKSESHGKVTKNKVGTVKTGHWVSPYDGKHVTVGSKLDIDHTVPLKEAWTSGAYKWSATKREAYANDLGYGPSLTAVTEHANRSKGDKEPGAYLPPLKSYRCAYVRNWIAVKYRWKLTVDKGEKATLRSDLARYCTTDWVKSPKAPKLSALIPKPKPKHSTKPEPSHGLDTRYATCTELKRHPNHAPYRRGVDPEYSWYQDRDHDGLDCE